VSDTSYHGAYDKSLMPGLLVVGIGGIVVGPMAAFGAAPSLLMLACVCAAHFVL
jgi:hypothetical protein